MPLELVHSRAVLKASLARHKGFFYGADHQFLHPGFVPAQDEKANSSGGTGKTYQLQLCSESEVCLENSHRRRLALPKPNHLRTALHLITHSASRRWRGRFLREDFADAANLRAHSAQFLFDIFVAAVNVIDAVDDGFAIGDERRQDQRR